ncbi:MAG: site-2 protease family protein [Pirellulales bacterium]|nr:site-2 protease family protein [Pirellulales bacterium]
MGMCVIAAALDPELISHWVLVILQVAVGLGAVIFVHELGHFAVAKLCGVKCEKFFIGFDIGGYKISRKWGETEYGVGILPLGGYVKMLGQDDNPANIAEQVRESEVAGDAPDAKEIIGPDGRTYLVDSRSYLAKSVPQRMAIISAGVIMNVIFAFIFAMVAYKIGVPYQPSIVSKTAPGSPAWRAGLRPGDEVVQVGEIVEPSFTDLMGSVTLADLENGLPFVIQRGEQRIEKTLIPEQGGELARIGVASAFLPRLSDQLAAFPNTPAAAAEPAFQPGDEVLAIDGQEVHSHAEIAAVLAQHPEKPLAFTVRRERTTPAGGPAGAKPASGEPQARGTTLDITVQPRPLKSLGLVMQLGAIVAVEENSPAAQAKLQPGDAIERIVVAEGTAQDADGTDLSTHPMLLAERLRRWAERGAEVAVSYHPAKSQGAGRQSIEERRIALRKVDWFEEPLAADDPMSAPELGIAYRVLSVVSEVEPGSSAEQAGLQADDVILKAEVLYGESTAERPGHAETIELTQRADDHKASWPALMARVQDLPEGAEVKLTYERGGETHEATLRPTALEGYYNPERGLVFDAITRTRVCETWGEAADRGWEETVRSLTMVYRFLQKLGTGQVPVTALGGPMTIAQAAGFSAFEGVGKLLVFLTMLSANLAVINFLPIPLLDGGHMVFLAWEGVRGRPASERLVTVLHTMGFAFIITLMLLVLSLDIRRIFFT